MKRYLWAAVLGLAIVGCGGNGTGTSLSTDRFAGTYSGVWINVDDATDSGTANFHFGANGVMTGEEFDPGGVQSGTLVGTIDATGNLTSVLTEETEVSDFNGRLALDGSGTLSGILVWQGPPLISYRYTLSPSP